MVAGIEMKALVCQGRGEKGWEEVPDAQLQADTDAVARVGTTTSCGPDPQILKEHPPGFPRGGFLAKRRWEPLCRSAPGWSSGPNMRPVALGAEGEASQQVFDPRLQLVPYQSNLLQALPGRITNHQLL